MDNTRWYRWSEKKPYSDRQIIITVEYNEAYRVLHEMYDIREYRRVVAGYIHKGDIFVNGSFLSSELDVIAWAELPTAYTEDIDEIEQGGSTYENW